MELRIRNILFKSNNGKGSKLIFPKSFKEIIRKCIAVQLSSRDFERLLKISI